ncbi:hypothetical protein CEXT_324981 [Caerostris extrusa]|uniref:Uncharacterized protein n=1 Tax=Caerostris extrusa TaxID=172846 RepID=A0AAV4V2Q6_CAEEX|nr:hypothetical protein CEXT_324981 [Caerostris extrusa]
MIIYICVAGIYTRSVRKTWLEDYRSSVNAMKPIVPRKLGETIGKKKPKRRKRKRNGPKKKEKRNGKNYTKTVRTFCTEFHFRHKALYFSDTAYLEQASKTGEKAPKRERKGMRKDPVQERAAFGGG